MGKKVTLHNIKRQRVDEEVIGVHTYSNTHQLAGTFILTLIKNYKLFRISSASRSFLYIFSQWGKRFLVHLPFRTRMGFYKAFVVRLFF